MAKSEIAAALDRLGGLANEWVMAETQRRVQASRDKKARTAEAYKYLIEKEDEQIDQYKEQFNIIQEGLLQRGVEMADLSDEYKTTDAKPLLEAANESALSMLSNIYGESQLQAVSYQNKLRNAKSVERRINMIDAFMSDVDPAESAEGDLNIIDAGDVRVKAGKYLDAYDEIPEILQRIEALQQPESIALLNQQYTDRRIREVQAKTADINAKNIDSHLKIKELEVPLKEIQEGINSMVQLPVFDLRMEFGNVNSLSAELHNIEDLESTDYTNKKQELDAEIGRLGLIFYPWLGKTANYQEAGSDMMSAIHWSAENNNHIKLSEYLKEANIHFSLAGTPDSALTTGQANLLRSQILEMSGIDISDNAWIDRLHTSTEELFRIQARQENEGLKVLKSLYPTLEDNETGWDSNPLVNEFMGGKLTE